MSSSISKNRSDTIINYSTETKPLINKKCPTGDEMVAKCWIIKHLALHILAFTGGGICAYGVLHFGFGASTVISICGGVIGGSSLGALLIRAYPPTD